MEVAKIDDRTSSQNRKYCKKFKNKEIKTIFNYGVLSTDLMSGYRCDSIARPTTSPIIYSQMLEGLRGTAFGGKPECLLIDVKDNLIGLPDEKTCFTLFDNYYIK